MHNKKDELEAKQREYEIESQWEQHPIETSEPLTTSQLKAIKDREYQIESMIQKRNERRYAKNH